MVFPIYLEANSLSVWGWV